MFKNEYGFIVYEFFLNSFSAPKNRSLLQIIIISKNTNDDFVNIAKKIVDTYVQYHIDQVECEVQLSLADFNNTETEMKENNEVYIKTEQIALHQFCEDIVISDIRNNEGNTDVIVTRNNACDMDIDFYYVNYV
jgi:hypothetical protein